MPQRGIIIAATRLIAMHQNKGKSITACLADRTDYAKNTDKTNNGELLSSYECDPITVQGEFMLNCFTKRKITGTAISCTAISSDLKESVAR